MSISVQELIGGGYGRGWYTNSRGIRYRVYASARNTKKSVDVMGFEPIMKILSNEYRNVLMARQNDTDNGSSTFPNIVARIGDMGLMRYFAIHTAPREIVYKPTRQKILFKGQNNPTGLTSLKAEHGAFTDVYFEEASELRTYEDFRKVDGSIRLGVKEADKFGLSSSDLQVTLCMNPWNRSHWIYDVFFKGRLEDDPARMEAEPYIDALDPDFSLGFGKGLYLHKANYKINEFRSPDYDENMAVLRAKAPDIYLVEGLGCWGNSTEGTYPEFSDSLIIPRSEALAEQYAMCAIGIDFGISDGEGRPLRGKDGAAHIGSATTMQLVGLTADYSRLVAIDEWFFSNEGAVARKTGPEIQMEIISKIAEWRDRLYSSHPTLLKGTVLVYVDSADSGGFRQGLEVEARRQGLFGCVFMPSTKIPIQTRVDFSRLLMAYGDLRVSEACPNLVRELRNARRADDGRPRADFDDHATNAWEYGWAPFRSSIRRWKSFKEH